MAAFFCFRCCAFWQHLQLQAVELSPIPNQSVVKFGLWMEIWAMAWIQAKQFNWRNRNGWCLSHVKIIEGLIFLPPFWCLLSFDVDVKAINFFKFRLWGETWKLVWIAMEQINCKIEISWWVFHAKYLKGLFLYSFRHWCILLFFASGCLWHHLQIQALGGDVKMGRVISAQFIWRI